MSEEQLGRRISFNDKQINRVGVIDIGSNSVRLVVFQTGHRISIPIFNEKALCGLGSDIKETGRLSETGRISAIVNIGRFVELARAMNLLGVEILATAAVREAVNGQDFVQDLERRFGYKVKTLSGDEEAQLSAYGVISSFPEADGFVGDLGGGSLELIDIKNSIPIDYKTFPLGSLLMRQIRDRSMGKVKFIIDDHLQKLLWLAKMNGRPFYAVGGAWRNLAQLHMAETEYPIQIIHGYEISVSNAIPYLDEVSTRNKNELRNFSRISKRRVEDLPIAALILSKILKIGKSSSVIFSSFGLREGSLYDCLTPVEKSTDPLLASCMEIAEKSQRFPLANNLLDEWVCKVLTDLSENDRRLLSAICMLSDIAWSEHPSYRAEHAFFRVVRLPVVGLNHKDRVFMGLSIFARYGGQIDLLNAIDVISIISPKRRKIARTIGLTLRLGLTLSAGLGGLISNTDIKVQDDQISIFYPWTMAAIHGDIISRRAKDLSNILGKYVVIEPFVSSKQN